MSYEKQTWATGDVITAEKLNHMEGGIEGEGGIRLVEERTSTEAGDVYTLKGATAKEVYDAMILGTPIGVVVNVSQFTAGEVPTPGYLAAIQLYPNDNLYHASVLSAPMGTGDTPNDPPFGFMKLREYTASADSELSFTEAN